MANSPKTVPTTASVAAYIDAVADAQRRADCQTLVAMMQAATGETPVLWGSAIVGFGAYRQTYAAGHSGDWPLLAFSPRKNDLTVYIMPGFEPYAQLMTRLGKHKTGKSCLYLKRLADVDAMVLRELLDAAVRALAPRRVAANRAAGASESSAPAKRPRAAAARASRSPSPRT